MADASAQTRVARVHQFLRHVGNKDVEQSLEQLSPDVVYRVEGNHVLAGVFSGREAVAGHLIGISEKTGGHLDPFKEDDVMVGVSHVSVLVNVRMQAQSSVIRTRYLLLLRFNTQDLIDHVTVFFEDLAAVERFYGPHRWATG